jgi:hypothetical protein
MERFRTCESCSRHVRAAEAKCPFCDAALDQATLLQVPRGPAQLSRAQRIALVAAVAGGSMLAACGDDAVAMPVYGAPVPRAGAGVAGATAGTGAAGGGGAAAGGGTAGRGAAGAPPIAVPVYGAPVPPPAGSGGGAGKAGSGAAGAAGSAGTAGTAGASAGAGGAAGHGMVVPVYGASPAYGVPPTPPPKK